MGKQKPDTFLSQLSKSFGQTKIVKLTIKRELKTQYPQLRKRLRRKQKQELLTQIKTNNDTQQITIRSNFNNKTLSTSATQTSINKFADSLSNIYRLFCYDQQRQIKKKQVLLPTQPNPKSKTQLRLKNQKLRNKERRIKRKQLDKLKKKEIQRQKTFASKKREVQEQQQQ